MKRYYVYFTYDGDHYKKEEVFAENEESALKKADKVYKIMRECGWFSEYAIEANEANA